jgi:SWI/SNF related-matrix-associated actin-dependent regulator of chromatin subfamily C
MSTPKISLKVPLPQDGASPAEDAEIAGGDVTAHDLSSAPGKEREREPVYGGDIANISTNAHDGDSMDVDGPNGGAYALDQVDADVDVDACRRQRRPYCFARLPIPNVVC